MKNLRWLREQGEMMNRDEYERFVPLTVKESVAEFMILYKTFFFMLDKVRDLDREQDEIYFTEMAHRLKRSRKRKHENSKSISQRRALAKTS